MKKKVRLYKRRHEQLYINDYMIILEKKIKRTQIQKQRDRSEGKKCLVEKVWNCNPNNDWSIIAKTSGKWNRMKKVQEKILHKTWDLGMLEEHV